MVIIKTSPGGTRSAVYGNSKEAAKFTGLVASVAFALGFVYVPLVTTAAVRYGKEVALKACLGCGMMGGAARWFLYRPDAPYLQIPEPPLMVPATVGFWVIVNSMKADVCDADELETGLRREGTFGAVST